MAGIDSENSSLHLSPLRLSSFEDSDLDQQNFSDISVPQLSDSLFRFVTPHQRVQAASVLVQGKARENLSNRFEGLGSNEIDSAAIYTTGVENTDTLIQKNQESEIAEFDKTAVPKNSSKTQPEVEPLAEAKEPAVQKSNTDEPNSIKTITFSENRSETTPTANSEPRTFQGHKTQPQSTTSKTVLTSRRANFSEMDKDLLELRKFHDSLTGRHQSQTMTSSKLRTPHHTGAGVSGFNNLSGLRSVSDQLDIDEEKDKREHYETMSVKLQSRVLELEEQLALSNASNIRKDRVVQELKQKLQTVLRKLEEASRDNEKEMEHLRDENDGLVKQVAEEKEKSRDVEAKFKEVLKIAENLREKFHDADSLSRTLQLELAELKSNNKDLQNDLAILDEENRRLTSIVSDSESDLVRIKLEKEKISAENQLKAESMKGLNEELGKAREKEADSRKRLDEASKELGKMREENKVLRSHAERIAAEKEEQALSFESQEASLKANSQRSEQEARQRLEEMKRRYEESTNQLRFDLAEESEHKLQGLVSSFEEQLQQLKIKMADEISTLHSQRSSERNQYKAQVSERDKQIAKLKQYNAYLSDHCKSMMQFQLMYFNAAGGGNSLAEEGVTAMPVLTQPPPFYPSKAGPTPKPFKKNDLETLIFNLNQPPEFVGESDKSVCVSSTPPRVDDYTSLASGEESGTVISSFNASSVKIYYPPVRDSTSATKKELRGVVEQVLKRQPIPMTSGGPNRTPYRAATSDPRRRSGTTSKTVLTAKKK